LRNVSCKPLFGQQIQQVDEKTAQILNAKAIASQKTPSEIVASLIREELTVTHVEG
jgi:hypothetical protein